MILNIIMQFSYRQNQKKNVLNVLNVPCSNDPQYHAEINALYKINTWKNKPKKINLLVIRLSKTGKLGESRPCYHCLLQLTKANIGIKYVYYSKNDKIIREKFDDMLYSQTIHISKGYRRKNIINTTN